LIPTNVKVARDKFTGVSRGFGFVDFETVETAISLMQSTAGGLYISQEFITLEYSRAAANRKKTSESTSVASEREEATYKDWICESVCVCALYVCHISC
jgi:RNA recognition motif-containing protein